MTLATLAAIAALCISQPVPPAAAPPSASVPKRLIAIGDNVKVRATPAADGQLLGYLFKNMVVEVLERGPRPEFVGYNSGYWYRVARGPLTGWAFGSFFSANVPARVIDTYDLPNLNDWWGNRFGWSTEYLENGIPDEALGKLEMDDYRGLIMMASNELHDREVTRAAWHALLNTLYPFLRKHGDDPKWAYLREKVWDPGFVGAMADKHGGDGIVEALPPHLLNDPAFKSAVCAKAGVKLAPCVKPAAPPR